MSDLPLEIDEMQLQEILKRASRGLKKTAVDTSAEKSQHPDSSPENRPKKPR